MWQKMQYNAFILYIFFQKGLSLHTYKSNQVSAYMETVTAEIFRKQKSNSCLAFFTKVCQKVPS